MSINEPSEQHQFACYYENLSALIGFDLGQVKGRSLSIDNQVLVHRLVFVLRKAPGDAVLLFDRTFQVIVSITNTSKKLVVGQIVEIKQTKRLAPSILILLPLLKREALEEALYSCVELGATEIQLVSTKKVHRSECDEKQMQRLQAVIVAAAEQSKNFTFPLLKAPRPLPEVVTMLPVESIRLFFQVDGLSFSKMVDFLRSHESSNIVMMVGPEGDCTQDEQLLLQSHDFNFFRLTPTVLRSRQAVAVGLGAIRSIVSSS